MEADGDMVNSNIVYAVRIFFQKTRLDMRCVAQLTWTHLRSLMGVKR